MYMHICIYTYIHPYMHTYSLTMVRNLDSGLCVMLILPDTSAAFDTINIDILLSTLGSRFNIGGTALDWFRSFLTGISQSHGWFVFFEHNSDLPWRSARPSARTSDVQYVHDFHCGYMYETSCAVPSIC